MNFSSLIFSICTLLSIICSICCVPVDLSKLNEIRSLVQTELKGLSRNSNNNNIAVYSSELSDTSSISCSSCEIFASWIAPFVRSNSTIESIAKVALVVCEIIKPQCSNPAACADLCTGVIAEHANEVIDIIANTVLQPSYVCFLVKLCPKPPEPVGPRPGIPVPSNLSDFRGQKQWTSWSNATGTGYFIQLSDIHIDLEYAPGSNTNCGEPLCCRQKNGPGTAGVWGDYSCDTTLILANDVLSSIASLTPPPDFILYTGDNPPHDIWEQSKYKNSRASNTVAQLFLTYFPNIPVFNAVGNHETFPVNQFEGPDYDSWLYNALAVDWGYWLPKDAIDTVLYGGYYQALVRPGLRIIAINDNYFMDGDFWLIQNDTDIASQFPWMINVLQQCRDRAEKAIIIGHGRPQDWVFNFTSIFQSIITEYSDVILNQFYGHTHTSGMTLFYPFDHNSSDSNPINLAFTGGSLTPFTDLNPGFRKYFYNRTFTQNTDYLVTNFEEYWSDLTETNKNNATNWNLTRIDALIDFDLIDMSPNSLQNLAKMVLSNKPVYNELISSRYKGHVPNHPWSPQEVSCGLLSSSDQLSDWCMDGLMFVKY